MTLDEAKHLTRSQEIYQNNAVNADGTPRRWRVNGKVKTWKLSPERVRVPLKHGMFTHDYLTEENMHMFETSERTAVSKIALARKTGGRNK